MPDGQPRWTIAWTPEGRRSLKHLPPRLLPAVLSFVHERLPENPLRASHALGAPLERYRSANVGSYRVLIQIDAPARTVYIVKVAYHADVYRPRDDL